MIESIQPKQVYRHKGATHMHYEVVAHLGGGLWKLLYLANGTECQVREPTLLDDFENITGVEFSVRVGQLRLTSGGPVEVLERASAAFWVIDDGEGRAEMADVVLQDARLLRDAHPGTPGVPLTFVASSRYEGDGEDDEDHEPPAEVLEMFHAFWRTWSRMPPLSRAAVAGGMVESLAKDSEEWRQRGDAFAAVGLVRRARVAVALQHTYATLMALAKELTIDSDMSVEDGLGDIGLPPLSEEQEAAAEIASRRSRLRYIKTT